MKFICILGDSAVGKMTVGQALEKLRGYSLFHNHMTIELVLDVFKTFHVPAIEALRQAIFDTFIETDLPGLIFTLQLAFNLQTDLDYLDNLISYFESHHIETYIVELDSTLDIRLERNKTDNRLKHKASKRDTELSELRLLNDFDRYRCISKPGEIKHKNFLRINNSDLSAEDAARLIIKTFNL